MKEEITRKIGIYFELSENEHTAQKLVGWNQSNAYRQIYNIIAYIRWEERSQVNDLKKPEKEEQI